VRNDEGHRPEGPGEGEGHHRGPRIGLCGSSALGCYPDTLIAFVSRQPSDTTLLLRRGNKSKPGLFEQVMAELASKLWLDVEWVRPEEDGGPGAVFQRDYELVSRSDLVLCYFHTTDMSGGTQHVVEAAIERETPVYAWGFTGSSFERVGEFDREDIWASSVPA